MESLGSSGSGEVEKMKKKLAVSKNERYKVRDKKLARYKKGGARKNRKPAAARFPVKVRYQV